MHESLKSRYLEVENPFILWQNLKDKFDHQKLVYLPVAEKDWAKLRLRDFKSVRAYSSALFKISSRLIMCGEKVTEKRKINKTLSTFHPNNINLAEMYRERKFTKFGDLLSTLLVAEQNHELVIKNHPSRPTGSAPLPEVNSMPIQQNVHGKGIEVDGAKVGTVDEVGATGIFVNIITLVIRSGNMNHGVKERPTRRKN
ncbi:uncharacterized protein LOC141686287 [Apium graveolens]|uniref:uncharacterized protein LOC141686287 n=1 Tax=Apium graveolens TaxID=4045 RepID=UPI003D78EAEF